MPTCKVGTQTEQLTVCTGRGQAAGQQPDVLLPKPYLAAIPAIPAFVRPADRDLTRLHTRDADAALFATLSQTAAAADLASGATGPTSSVQVLQRMRERYYQDRACFEKQREHSNRVETELQYAAVWGPAPITGAHM